MSILKQIATDCCLCSVEMRMAFLNLIMTARINNNSILLTLIMLNRGMESTCTVVLIRCCMWVCNLGRSVVSRTHPRMRTTRWLDDFRSDIGGDYVRPEATILYVAVYSIEYTTMSCFVELHPRMVLTDYSLRINLSWTIFSTRLRAVSRKVSASRWKKDCHSWCWCSTVSI